MSWRQAQRPDPAGAERVSQWLVEWPIPFKSRAHALEFFGAHSRWARAWCDGLEPTPQGLMPAFDADIMVATLETLSGRSYWAEWQLIECPTLLFVGREDSLHMRPLAWPRRSPVLRSRSSLLRDMTRTSNSRRPGKGFSRLFSLVSQNIDDCAQPGDRVRARRGVRSACMGDVLGENRCVGPEEWPAAGGAAHGYRCRAAKSQVGAKRLARGLGDSSHSTLARVTRRR